MRRFLLAAAACLGILTAVPAFGQTDCRVVGAVVDGKSPEERWTPPLDRAVTLELIETSLAEALAEIAAEAGVRISYSSDTFEAERPVCISTDPIALGSVLRELLGDYSVEVRVIARDHIVLSPAQGSLPADGIAALEPTPERVIPLETVVVTGDPARISTDFVYTRDILGSRRIADRGTDEIARLLNGSGPGLLAWITPPSDLRTRYAGMRGASSFGSTYPKIYIDGIPVADPLALSRITPEAIDRIEVIRGPQGAALFGSGAISGVVDIRTRAVGPGSAPAGLQFRSGAGVVGSDYAVDRVLSQDHVLTGWLRREGRSAMLNVALGRTGDYAYNSRNSYFSGVASGHSVAGDRLVTAIARLDVAVAGVGPGRTYVPFATFGDRSPGGDVIPTEPLNSRSTLQYTVGTTVRRDPEDGLESEFGIGLDGYRLSAVADASNASAWQAPDAGFHDRAGDRLTLRGSTTWRAVRSPDASAAITIGAERSTLREAETSSDLLSAAFWRTTTGFLLSTTADLRNTLSLDAGVRFESESGPGADWTLVPLPRIGGAIVLDGPGITARLRSGYGRSIRSSALAIRDLLPNASSVATATDLPPESQSGFESALDLSFGDHATVQLTRFDQRATGLLQAIPTASSTLTGDPDAIALGVRFANVGEIANAGWETRITARLGQLGIDAGLATVNSRVRRLADDPSTDLRPGDRMPEIPAKTANLTATWSADHWSAALTASHAWNWIGYDWNRVSADRANGNEIPDGAALRTYWRQFEGSTRLDANAAFEIRPDISLLITADNLLDVQRGGPDELSVLPGRTLSVGLRARF